MGNKYEEHSRKAQLERKRKKSCEGKVAYATRYDAEYRIPAGQNVYECEFCNQWHRSGSMGRLIDQLKKEDR